MLGLLIITLTLPSCSGVDRIAGKTFVHQNMTKVFQNHQDSTNFQEPFSIDTVMDAKIGAIIKFDKFQ